MVQLRLVPEVLLHGAGIAGEPTQQQQRERHGASSSGEDDDWLGEADTVGWMEQMKHRLRFCIRIVPQPEGEVEGKEGEEDEQVEGTIESCFAHDELNEHSPLLMRIRSGKSVFRVWLLNTETNEPLPGSANVLFYDSEDPRSMSAAGIATDGPDGIGMLDMGISIGKGKHVHSPAAETIGGLGEGGDQLVVVPVAVKFNGTPHELLIPMSSWVIEPVQRVVGAFCMLHSLAAVACAAVARHAQLEAAHAMERYAEAEAGELKVTDGISIDVARARGRAIPPLPPQSPLPTIAHPFVFLHLEKCAGTSLKAHIADKAATLGLRSYIPCHHDLPCEVFHFPPIEAERVKAGHNWYSEYRTRHEWSEGPIPMVSGGGEIDSETGKDEALVHTRKRGGPVPQVIGGHFEWGADAWGHGRREEDIRCFVMLREPLSRAISFYYERVFPDSKKAFGELSVEELEWYMVNWRGSAFSRWRDEGMSNAAFKMLGGGGGNIHKGRYPHETDARAEAEAETKMAAEAVLGLPHEQTVVGIKIAEQRLRRCVVGLQEEWSATKRVLWHWFPWMQFEDTRMENTGMGSRAEKPAQLRPELLAVIRQHNLKDLALYKIGRSLMQRQLEALGEQPSI
jgi:hypothetical protein